MEVNFKFKKGDIVKRTDINYSSKYEISGAIQIKHVDWNADGETMTWKVENRYYLEDVLGRQLDETVSEVWLKEYEEKSKEKNQNLLKKVYLLIEAAPYEYGDPIGFFYDEEKAKKKKEELIKLEEERYGSSWVRYRIQEVDLMEE